MLSKWQMGGNYGAVSAGWYTSSLYLYLQEQATKTRNCFSSNLLSSTYHLSRTHVAIDVDAEIW